MEAASPRRRTSARGAELVAVASAEEPRGRLDVGRSAHVGGEAAAELGRDREGQRGRRKIGSGIEDELAVGEMTKHSILALHMRAGQKVASVIAVAGVGQSRLRCVDACIYKLLAKVKRDACLSL
jgi:hypothetical protein